MDTPLKHLRVAVTIPSAGWFGGISNAYAADMAQELRDLGADVLPVDVDAFSSRDSARIDAAIAALKSFRPSVALSLPNAGYAILCSTPDGRNVFRDVLEIPTVLLWDHGPLQFARLLLGPPPPSPAESTRGCLDRLRETVNHPLYVHYSPDRGYIRAMHQLGILDQDQIQFFLQPAFPYAVQYGAAEETPAAGPRVAFAGNLYIAAAERLAFRKNRTLAALEGKVFAAKAARLTDNLWDLLAQEIESLDGETRRDLALEPDSTFFWGFVHDEIETVGNSTVRLGVLTGLEGGVDFFGNFVEPESIPVLSGRYGIRYQRSVDPTWELADLFASSEILVDVINLGYQSGTSPKIMDCLACGGFPLFDYKQDFRDCVGPEGDLLMYRSIDHLNAMVEDYLTHPARRREVTRGLRARVHRDFTFGALCRRVLDEEPLWRQPGTREHARRPAGPAPRS
jgi:hypothetical protein